jgi:acetyl-CoA carboxylase alpha subunit
VQTAENLVDKGVIDAVVTPEDLAEVATRALSLLRGSTPVETRAPVAPDPPPTSHDTWSSVLTSRHLARPGVRELLRHAATDVVPVSGTGAGEAGGGLLSAFATFGDLACVVVGQDRRVQRLSGPLGPDALRTARRMMAVAEQLGLPLVYVVDTPGADLSAA